MAESQYATCRILYANDPPDESAFETDDWIEIEQIDREVSGRDWLTTWLKENPPSTTSHSLDTAISRINGMHAAWAASCSDDDCIEIELEVHKSRTDLDYDLTASYGELSEKFKAPKDKIETVEIDGDESYTLKTEVNGAITAEWEGDVVGEMTEGVTQILDQPPAIIQDGQTLNFGRRVWGTLSLKYTASPDTWFLTLEPREAGDYDQEDPESAYASTVRAVWAGEPVSHEVDIPTIDTACGGSSVVIDPDDPNAGRCYDLKVTRHKCTNDIISEELVQVPCPGDGQEDDS